MKLSTKGRYGVRILLDLATHQSDSPRTLQMISTSQKISLKYMSRLLPKFAKAGVVSALRGAEGGYRLLRDPKDLTFLEIIEIMEGPTHLVPCRKASKPCKWLDSCPMTSVWDTLTEQVRQVFAKYTLQDALDAGEAKWPSCESEEP